MKRKFSIPFNGINADMYLQTIMPFKSNVDDIYVGPPLLCNNHANIIKCTNSTIETEETFLKKIMQYDDNCYSLLEKTYGEYKRIIPINSGFYSFTKMEMQMFVIKKLKPVIEKYKIEGLILTDYNMACYIHELFPQLELHTSCNCFQWTVRTMDVWRRNAGISVFNPPREILRTPTKLKEFHDAGFKLKCLINESCLYGCPQTVNHCMYLADGNQRFSTKCNRNDLANVFRSNWVLPRWLNKLDENVDIYKISGRNSSLEYIVRTLRAYITENNNINLLDIIIGGTSHAVRRVGKHVNIPVSVIPDELLSCECKCCDDGCNICEKLAEKYICKHSEVR